MSTTSQRKQINAELEPEYYAALDRIRVDVGISITEQVRRALKLWFAQHGVTLEDGHGAKQSAARRR